MEKLRLREYDTVQFTRMARSSRLFTGLRMDLLEKLLAWLSLYRYRKGEKICREGEAGDSFFVVYEGRVAVSARRWLFFRRRVAELGPGGCFGEMALLRQEPRRITVTCLEDTTVFVLRAEDFGEALKGNPAFAEEMRRLAAALESAARPS